MSVNDHSGLGPGEDSKTVAVPGTPEPLSATPHPCRNVAITARSGNTKQVAIGFDNSVRAAVGGEKGVVLQPGGSISIPIPDPGSLWLDAIVVGEGVSFAWL